MEREKEWEDGRMTKIWVATKRGKWEKEPKKFKYKNTGRNAKLEEWMDENVKTMSKKLREKASKEIEKSQYNINWK
jgi:hypothetical protein